MKIETLKIENFRSIANLELDLKGGNAVISGQNGTGKTTVLDAVCWLFTNKMSNGKVGESSNLHNAEQITTVEVVFEDGLKLRRECNGKSTFFINNAPCNATEFKSSTAEIFKGAIPALLTPFNFCTMHYSERRNILLKQFAAHIEVDMTDFGEIAADLKKLTPAQIIKGARFNKKKLEEQLATIPARIEELQVSVMTVDLPALRTEKENVQSQLDNQSKLIKQIQEPSAEKIAAYNRYVEVDKQTRELKRRIEDLRAEYRNNEAELNRLNKEFDTLQKAATGPCPLCGSSVPAENLDSINARIQSIVAQGKEIFQKQELLKQGAEVAKSKAVELEAQAADYKAQYEALNKNHTTTEDLQGAILKRDELQQQLAQLQAKVAEVERSATIQKRIEKLKAQEVSAGAEISKYDKQIYQAEMYIRRQIELTEKAINDQFQFIKFKMFEDLKTMEGVKECCEPVLNGIPYVALSKGEQLKASLDILRALQKAYGVELPVFIDDAESYTSNSFVDLPNQVILLKAVEDVNELQIDIINAANNFESQTA